MGSILDLGRALFGPLLLAGVVLGPTAAVVALGQNLTGALVMSAKAPVEICTIEAPSAQGIGPAYLENVKNVTCPNTTAGASLSASCNQLSTSCECDGNAFFAHTGQSIGTDGRAETNFDGNVRALSCRSSSGSVACDCWALCASEPD